MTTEQLTNQKLQVEINKIISETAKINQDTKYFMLQYILGTAGLIGIVSALVKYL